MSEWKETSEFITDIQNWEVRYEHNISQLEDLLEVVQQLELDIKKQMRKEL